MVTSTITDAGFTLEDASGVVALDRLGGVGVVLRRAGANTRRDVDYVGHTANLQAISLRRVKSRPAIDFKFFEICEEKPTVMVYTDRMTRFKILAAILTLAIVGAFAYWALRPLVHPPAVVDVPISAIKHGVTAIEVPSGWVKIDTKQGFSFCTLRRERDCSSFRERIRRSARSSAGRSIFSTISAFIRTISAKPRTARTIRRSRPSSTGVTA